jgi:hypothetical protein
MMRTTNTSHVVVPPDEEEKQKPAPVALASESSLPLWQSGGLALVYMFGCITFYLLIRFSKKKGVHYDSAGAVFFTELCKWSFSVAAMYYRTGKFLPFSVFREGSWRVGIYFAVPSAIYAIYNNLTYFNLDAFDPGTYQVFMQTRVLFTGILYTWILNKALTRRKWAALVLLTIGVMVKYFTFDLKIDYRVIAMLFQASLSAFAGVYNEFLLKRDITMDVNEQNFFMYSFALFFNFGWGLLTNPHYYTSGMLLHSLNGVVLIIVLNGALVGIVTSLILKFINVIVKAFASACEVLLTAVLASFFLGEALTGQDVIACGVVMWSIYVYYTVATSEKPKEDTALKPPRQ